MHRLEQKGNSAVIFELQGSLFFGTTHQLYLTLEPELATTDYLILDMQRVQSVDVTAAHMLNQVRDVLSERGVPLLISSVRERLPNGRNLREFLELTGLNTDGEKVIIMPTLEAAIGFCVGCSSFVAGFGNSSTLESPTFSMTFDPAACPSRIGSCWWW